MARPRTPLLDRDRIVTAAAAIVDREGDFTVGRLARELGVHPSSLYHHVSGKDEVVDLLRERVGAEIDASGFGSEPWDDALIRLARSYRLAFARRPGAIKLLATSPIRDATALGAYDRIAQALRDAGFATDAVLPIIESFDNYLLGSALALAAAQEMFQADPGAHPALWAATTARSDGPDAEDSAAHADRVFEVGLEALLVGFRHLLASTTSPAG